MATTNRTSHSVTFLFGAGDGTFGNHLELPTGLFPFDCAAADLDQDGHVGLVVIKKDDGANDVRLFMGNGDGTFSFNPLNDLEAGDQPIHVRVVDLNRDQRDDLLILNRLSSFVTVQWNLGNGQFARQDIRTGKNYVGSIATGDFDGDGWVDIFVSAMGNTSMLRMGSADGTFDEIAPVRGFGTLYALGMSWNGDSSCDLISIKGDKIDVYAGTRLPAGEDSWAPNQSCADAALLPEDLHEDLVVFDGQRDFFEVEVPVGESLSWYVRTTPGEQLLQYRLFAGSGQDPTCGDPAALEADGTADSVGTYGTWTNTGTTAQSVVMELLAASGSGPGGCIAYALSIDLHTTAAVRTVCVGDGSLMPCPCANEMDYGAPPKGCKGSSGGGAELLFLHSNSFVVDNAVFRIEGADANQPSLLVQGTTFLARPFKDGIFCLGSPTSRLEVVMLDSSGEGQTHGSIVTAGAIPGPGVTRYYQFWYRDPDSTCGTGSNFSAGLEVLWE